jgi:hypothetical protein
MTKVRTLLLAFLVASGVIAGAVVAPARAALSRTSSSTAATNQLIGERYDQRRALTFAEESARVITPTARPDGLVLHPCTDPNYVSSANPAYDQVGVYIVSQDEWGRNNPFSQTMNVCAHNSFFVNDTVQNDAGAVQTYPDIYENMPSDALSSYATLTSKFAILNPPTGPGLDYEFAYDNWSGPGAAWSSASEHTEMMIWEYTDGQVPAGSVVATTTIDGIGYKVWFAGGLGQSNGDIVSYEAVANQTSGITNLLAFYQDAAGRGYLDGGMNTDLWQLDWGTEVCATPSGGATFSTEASNIRSSQ